MSPRVVKGLILRYGLEDGHPRTLRALAMVVGMGVRWGRGRVLRLRRHG